MCTSQRLRGGGPAAARRSAVRAGLLCDGVPRGIGVICYFSESFGVIRWPECDCVCAGVGLSGGRGRLLTHVHRASACTLNAVGLLPMSGCGDARVAPPCPTTLCVWRNLPYLTLPVDLDVYLKEMTTLVYSTGAEQEGPAHNPCVQLTLHTPHRRGTSGPGRSSTSPTPTVPHPPPTPMVPEP